METRELFLQALARLRARFPSAFTLRNAVSDTTEDWGNEPARIRELEDFIRSCDWDTLGTFYTKRVNDLYAEAQRDDATVGTKRPSLRIHCRALIQAIDDLS